jgi:hypothetical protein
MCVVCVPSLDWLSLRFPSCILILTLEALTLTPVGNPGILTIIFIYVYFKDKKNHMCRFVLKRWFITCKYIQLYRYITIEKFGDSTCRCVLKSILYNLTSLLGFVIYCNRIKNTR